MTVLAAITNGTDTWVAADLAASNHHDLPYRGRELAVQGEWGIGAAGEPWAIELALDGIESDVWSQANPRVFMRAWWRVLRHAGWSVNHSCDGSAPGFNIHGVLARAGRLWAFHDDGFPHEIELGRLVARGSGDDVALGYGWAVSQIKPGMRSFDLVANAVRAACALKPSCGVGVDLLHMGRGSTPSVRRLDGDC